MTNRLGKICVDSSKGFPGILGRMPYYYLGIYISKVAEAKSTTKFVNAKFGSLPPRLISRPSFSSLTYV